MVDLKFVCPTVTVTRIIILNKMSETCKYNDTGGKLSTVMTTDELNQLHLTNKLYLIYMCVYVICLETIILIDLR